MWGPGASAGFQNALAMGQQSGNNIMQAFQQGRAMKEQRDYRNALAQFDPSKPETLNAVMQVRPEVGFQLRGQMQQQQAAQQENDLTTRALAGDDAALSELATVNYDKWRGLSADIKAKTKADADLLGGAALDLLQVPAGPQRRDRLITYAQQFPQFAEKINEVAFLPPAEQEARLRAVVAEAGLIGKLHEMERPSYQVLPAEATLVNTKDPSAVRQFQGGGGGFQEGQTATNPQTGQKLIYRNGAWSPM